MVMAATTSVAVQVLIHAIVGAFVPERKSVTSGWARVPTAASGHRARGLGCAAGHGRAAAATTLSHEGSIVDRVQTVEAVVPREPAACWRAFTDAAAFAAWIPGLRRARVIQVGSHGLPAEILFEFGASRTYSLVYTYDLERREVRWEARANKRDAVAGFARFEPAEQGTHVTYGLASSGGDDVNAVLAAFVQWMASAPSR